MTVQSTGDMIQVHMLTAYPAALLNRDDVGLAKRIPFGGKVRTRISSQCLKKHWRDSPLVTELGEMAHRSTRIYEQLVARPLEQEHGASEEEAAAITHYLMDMTLRAKKGASSEDVEGTRTGQVLVLTRAETRFLAEKGAEILGSLREKGIKATKATEVKDNVDLDQKELSKLLQALPASLDTALFGRFVTSDVLARVDGAVSVAHAFTTHAEAAETDYFTAVDDLNIDDAGAGLISDTELTTGVFYLYTVIDMNQLRANLGEQADIAEKLAANLTRTMATVSPGAKRGSTAPYAYAEFVLLERGPNQPRTLANAFLKPVAADGSGLMNASIGALLKHRGGLADMYGEPEGTTVVSSIHPIPEDSGPSARSFDEALSRIIEEES